MSKTPADQRVRQWTPWRDFMAIGRLPATDNTYSRRRVVEPRRRDVPLLTRR